MVSGWEERKSKGRRVPLQRFRARRAARRSSSQLGRGELFRPAPFTSTAVIVELAGVQDHYAVLGLSPLAPLQLIRQAYLQQIRVAHPDRAAQGAGVRAGAVAQSTTADELNWAWEVLGDEQRRAAYDEERRRSKAAHLAPSTIPTIALTLDLEDFSPIFPPSQAGAEDDAESQPSHYEHPCRCSGTFVITEDDLERGVEVVQCDGCTERCRVEYQVLEDDEEA